MTPRRGAMAVWLLALGGALALTGCAATPAKPSTAGDTRIVVVRHAEKAALPATDPPLTGAGHARARALRDALRPLAPSAAYATVFARTRQTAAPTAAALGLQVDVYDAAPVDLARRLLASHHGDTVLVVGHSNTVPAIVSALCRCEVGPINESRYGDRFDVTVASDGRATLVHGDF